jgi:hypothetical protein
VSETYDLPGPQPAAPEPPRPADPRPEAGPHAEPPFAVAETERPPEPLGVTVVATGNAEVDAAVERLADADALPTDGHIEVYEDVHQGLRDALAALDENRG